MMTPILRRSFAPDLEITGDGRTIAGVAVPFNQPAQVRDHTGSYTESFRRGAFARTLTERGAERVKLLVQHDMQSLPLGRATVLREEESGLYGEFRVSQTRAGDEVLELVRDGALDGLSIGFRPLRETRSAAGVVERTEVALHEVSLTAFPIYDTARVVGVRSEQERATALSGPELTYLARMVEHHRAAVEMSQALLDRHLPASPVTAFAQSIISAQTAEISTMLTWLGNATPTPSAMSSARRSQRLADLLTLEF